MVANLKVLPEVSCYLEKRMIKMKWELWEERENRRNGRKSQWKVEEVKQAKEAATEGSRQSIKLVIRPLAESLSKKS
jgi:hypothetical protein